MAKKSTNTEKQSKKQLKPKVKRRTGHLAPYQWKAGKSGNPKGRPKKEKCVTEQINMVLDEVPIVLLDGSPNVEQFTWARILAERLVLLAAAGNAAAVREVLERAEGKVVEKVQMQHDVMPLDEAASILKKMNGKYSHN